MKTFLWITILGSALALLTVAGEPQPPALPHSAPLAECKCSDLKALELELQNAIKLQQAFTAQIADLRKMNSESAAMTFSNFAKSTSITVTRPATDKGPEAIDYISRGETVSPDDQGKVTGEGLCLKSDNAELALRDLDSGATCAGIARAVHAHEDYHQSECSRLTYMIYREKHPADRAAEEAAAYGVQIAMLRAEIRRVRDLKDCKRYKAAGQDGPVVYSGVICDLDKPFTVNGTHPMVVYPLKFVPSSTTGGTFSYGVSQGMMSMEGGGTYTVEGLDTDKPHIVCKVNSTARIPMASSSGGGFGNIQLIPLETDECNGK